MPAEWRDAFNLTSVAVAPLVAHGVPIGALAIDHMSGARAFAPEQLRTLEGLAALAAVALRHGRAAEAAAAELQTRDDLLALTEELSRCGDLPTVLASALDAFGRLTGAAAVGAGMRADSSAALLRGRSDGLDRLALAYLMCEQGAGVGWVPAHPAVGDLPLLVVPLPDEQETLGFLVAAGLATEPPAPVLDRVRSLAVITGMACARLQHRDRARAHGQCRDALQAVVLAPRGRVDLGLVVEQLAPLLRQVAAVEPLEIRLADPATARLCQAPARRDEINALLRAWRRAPQQAAIVLTADRLVVPLVTDGRLLGALVARPRGAGPRGAAPEVAAAEVLRTTAADIAGLLVRLTAAAEVAAAERELAVSAEHCAAAAGASRRAARELTAAQQRLQVCTEGSRDVAQQAALRDTAGVVLRAQRHLHEAALAVPASDGSNALRQRLKILATDALNGRVHDLQLSTSGRPRPLPAPLEGALLRATQRALSVARELRPVLIVIELRYTPDRVQVRVSASGETLPDHLRQPTLPEFAEARDQVQRCGGGLSFRKTDRLAVITLWVPAPGAVPAPSPITFRPRSV